MAEAVGVETAESTEVESVNSQEDRRDIARHHTGPSGELGIDGAAKLPPHAAPTALEREYGVDEETLNERYHAAMLNADRNAADLDALEQAARSDRPIRGATTIAQLEYIAKGAVGRDQLVAVDAEGLLDLIAAAREADALRAAVRQWFEKEANELLDTVTAHQMRETLDAALSATEPSDE